MKDERKHNTFRIIKSLSFQRPKIVLIYTTDCENATKEYGYSITFPGMYILVFVMKFLTRRIQTGETSDIYKCD